MRWSLDRFWKKIDVRGPDECWPWTGWRDRKGYGQVTVNWNRIQAHRVVYEVTSGHIPEGMCVLHACDNPPCCNPAHLHLGTKADNAREMKERGRAPHTRLFGERNGRAKLSPETMQEIRWLHAVEGFSLKRIARMFGLAKSHVGAIVNRKKWAHI